MSAGPLALTSVSLVPRSRTSVRAASAALALGNGLSGLIVGIMRLGCKLGLSDDENGLRTGALICFGTAAAWNIACLVMFEVLRRHLAFTEEQARRRRSLGSRRGDEPFRTDVGDDGARQAPSGAMGAGDERDEAGSSSCATTATTATTSTTAPSKVPLQALAADSGVGGGSGVSVQAATNRTPLLADREGAGAGAGAGTETGEGGGGGGGDGEGEGGGEEGMYDGDKRALLEGAESYMSSGGDVASPRTSWEVARRLGVIGGSLCLTLFITLLLFPGVVAGIQSDRWPENQDLVSIFLILDFLVFDAVGRVLPRVAPRPLSARELLGGALTRLVFIPLFWATSRYPHSFGAHDIAPFVLVCVFACSNGFLLVECMSTGPQRFEADADKALAGTVLVLFLIVGIASGSLLAMAVKPLFRAA